MKDYKILIAGLIIMALIANLGFILMHEASHVAIYKGEGIDSKIKINARGIYTLAERPCETDVCRLSHNLNEIVGYHLLGTILIILNMILSYCIVREVRR